MVRKSCASERNDASTGCPSATAARYSATRRNLPNSSGVPGGAGYLELVVLLDDLELAQVRVVPSVDDLAHSSWI